MNTGEMSRTNLSRCECHLWSNQHQPKTIPRPKEVPNPNLFSSRERAQPGSWKTRFNLQQSQRHHRNKACGRIHYLGREATNLYRQWQHHILPSILTSSASGQHHGVSLQRAHKFHTSSAFGPSLGVSTIRATTFLNSKLSTTIVNSSTIGKHRGVTNNWAEIFIDLACRLFK